MAVCAGDLRPGRANDRQGAAQRAVRGGAAGRAHLIRGDGGRAGPGRRPSGCAVPASALAPGSGSATSCSGHVATTPISAAEHAQGEPGVAERKEEEQQRRLLRRRQWWLRRLASGVVVGGGAGAAEASGRADSSSYIYTCVHQPWSVKRVRQKQWGSHRTSGGQEGAAVFTLKCSFSGPAQHMHEGGDRLMAEGTNLDRGAPRHRSRTA